MTPQQELLEQQKKLVAKAQELASELEAKGVMLIIFRETDDGLGVIVQEGYYNLPAAPVDVYQQLAYARAFMDQTAAEGDEVIPPKDKQQ